MPNHIQKTPQAAADLIDIASYIAEDNLDAAERFLDAAEGLDHGTGHFASMSVQKNQRINDGTG